MSIIDIIPKGSKNAISRSYLLTLCKEYGIADNDREMRRLIEKERATNCIICLSDGKGYYIPDENDKDKLRHYINQEHGRSISIMRNLKMANNLLEDMEVGRV